MPNEKTPLPPAPPPSKSFTPEQRQRVIAELAKRVNLNCPRCGTEKFDIVNAVSSFSIESPAMGSISIGGPIVPVVLTVCVHCGFVAPHALGVLGFMTPEGVKI